MGIQMIQCAISLLAAVPTTLVHALDFFVTSSRTLVLLGTRDRDERINLPNVVLLKLAALQNSKEQLLETFAETSQ